MNNKYSFLLYPLLVGLVVLFGTQIITSNISRLTGLSQNKDEVARQQERIKLLENKLQVLEGVDLTVANQRLAELTKIIPPTKNIWNLVAEINYAASDSGVTISGYKGKVGKVSEASDSASIDPTAMTVSIQMTTLDPLRLSRFLNKLEVLKPLIKVNKVTYEAGTTEVVLEGAWSAWQKEAELADTPLPDYLSEADMIISQVQNYNHVPQFTEADIPVSDQAITNPF